MRGSKERPRPLTLPPSLCLCAYVSDYIQFPAIHPEEVQVNIIQSAGHILNTYGMLLVICCFIHGMKNAIEGV